MPVQVTYPGVYVEELPSGVHTISGVATSVAAFVGMTASGPVNVPTRIFSFREFDTQFGGSVDVGEMPAQVRQFFLNGGGEAWIVRNAMNALDGAAMTASSTLLAEDAATNVLVVRARSAGTAGNQLRVEIDYDTASPERTFNLTVFRQVLQSDGTAKRESEVTYPNLSMDPASLRFAPKVVTEESDLISAEAHSDIAAPPAAPVVNVSQSGLIFSNLPAFAVAHLPLGTPRLLLVSVANRPPVTVDLQGLPNGPLPGDVTDEIEIRINTALADAGETVTVDAAAPAVAGGVVIRISSTQGPVAVSSAGQDDAAVLLRLGAANGGLESDQYSSRRPAANGFLSRVHGGTSLATAFGRVQSFAAVPKNELGNWTVAGNGHNATGSVPAFVGSTDLMAFDLTVTGLTGVAGSFDGVADSLSAIVGAINADPGQHFTAYRAGHRIGIRPRYGNQDSDLSLGLTTVAVPPAPTFTIQGNGEIAQQAARPTNVATYAIGLAPPVPPAPAPAPATPAGAYRGLVQAGNDGEPPLPGDYEYSWDKLERTADIFNLMVLPRARGTAIRQSDADRIPVWQAASAFCQRRRAFLIVDPPSDPGVGNWDTANKAATGVALLRSGIVTDHAAIYWPRVIASDAKGKPIVIDPAGTMAGVYAKTDTRRGIWKAPAGLEATLGGVGGLEFAVTNPENGITNPRALNTLRSMVSGATSWGARTMMGYDGAPDQDYRYIPVRRLALYIEESLYRGLQFAVFEPNGEVLWGQIRLAAGSFMNGLFRRGAFKGLKTSEAYFVACGPTTTTQADINLGIVNVEVGFAALKPAEFVIIKIKQLAGQIET